MVLTKTCNVIHFALKNYIKYRRENLPKYNIIMLIIFITKKNKNVYLLYAFNIYNKLIIKLHIRIIY